MRKSLELQAELGPVFDVTLDGEDGAPAGGEVEHAQLIAELVQSPANRFDRVGARIVPRGHAAFEAMLEVLLRDAGSRLAYLMIPKPRDGADFEAAVHAVDLASRAAGLAREVPLHALVETHGALRDVELLAAHPRLESLSFGLMDFVSAHRGAIPQSAMGAEGQFAHPLVVRAKLAIAAACHGHSKTPSHCVVTEFKDTRPAATRRRARLPRVRLHAHVEHPSRPDPGDRRRFRAGARRDRHGHGGDRGGPGRRLGADPPSPQRPRGPARPGELSLLLARDRARASHVGGRAFAAAGRSTGALVRALMAVMQLAS